MTAKNSGKNWTKTDVQKPKELVKGNTPTRLIGRELGRSPDAVYNKADELDISLKPVNQSPYNRREK